MGLRLDEVVPWGRSLQEYYSVEIKQVPYEFHKGGNQLLRVIGVG